MKIFIIANGYPTKQEPQWGCFEKDQALALKKLGHDVSILYVDKRFRFFWRRIGISCFNEYNINIYGIYYIPLIFINIINRNWAYKFINYMLDKLYSFTIKKEGKPDLIYAHFLDNISYAVKLKNKYNLPLVGMEHWSILNNTKLPSYVVKQGKIAYSGADRIVAVSTSLKEKIFDHFGRNSVVIHNMVGEEFFIRVLNEQRDNSKLFMISTGSLIRRKGYDILIKALSIINCKLGDWNLKIIGDGPEKDKLIQLINENHLNNNIELIGRKNKQEIITLLHESNLFVFPSRMENFSVAVLEALSAGLPIVATDCGGIKECIDENNGILVPVEDVGALANAILIMYKDLKEYNRKNIALDCKSKFAPEVIAHQLSTLFDEVVSKHQSLI